MNDPGTWLIHAHADGVSFDVVVVTRASRSRVVGIVETAHGAALKLTLAAAPVDGDANAELCAVVAKALAVPKRAVRVTHGAHNKHKTVHVAGVSPERARALAGCAESGFDVRSAPKRTALSRQPAIAKASRSIR